MSRPSAIARMLEATPAPRRFYLVAEIATMRADLRRAGARYAPVTPEGRGRGHALAHIMAALDAAADELVAAIEGAS